jgi:hypothetical protein
MHGARQSFAGLVTAAMLSAGGAAPAAAQADLTWRDAPAVAFDILLLRPLSAAATIAGVPLFAVAAPVAAISGRFLSSLDVLVLAPADYTFRRPLADF